MKPYIFRNSLGHKLEITSRLMSNGLNQVFRRNEFAITIEQWGIINFLAVEDGVSQNQLALMQGKDHTSISRLIDNLIKKQFVNRVSDSVDRRTNLIYLTEKGRRLQEKSVELVQEHNGKALDGIDPEDIKICQKVLDQIVRNLN